jgi:hypothetical protein
MSFFGGEFEIIPYNDYLPRWNWFRTHASFHILNKRLVGITCTCIGNGFQGTIKNDDFEELCLKYYGSPGYLNEWHIDGVIVMSTLYPSRFKPDTEFSLNESSDVRARGIIYWIEQGYFRDMKFFA